jgi:hypothetical protein
MPKQSIFTESDPIYECFLCSKKLRYSIVQKAVVEIDSALEHSCKTGKTIATTNKQDVVSLAWKRGDSHLFKGDMAIYPDIGAFQITVEPNSDLQVNHATGEAAKSQGDKNMMLSLYGRYKFGFPFDDVRSSRR